MELPFDVTNLEPGLFISEHPRSASRLADLPVAAILNVCDFGEPSYRAGLHPDIQLVHWPFEDACPVPYSLLAVSALELIELRRRGRATLIHCHMGRSRSVTLVVLFWMARDGITWSEAVARFETLRPCHLKYSGQSYLLTFPVRDRILSLMKRYLAGEFGLLAQYRDDAERYREACRNRPSDPASQQSEWSLIEEGLAIGQTSADWPELTQHGFDHVLIVSESERATTALSFPSEVQTSTLTFPVEESLNQEVLLAAVHQLAIWRDASHRVFVLGPDEEYFAVMTTCVWFMVYRNWDLGSAFWYLASRRPDWHRYIPVLLETDWDQLVMEYRSRFSS